MVNMIVGTIFGLFSIGIMALTIARLLWRPKKVPLSRKTGRDEIQEAIDRWDRQTRLGGPPPWS